MHGILLVHKPEGLTANDVVRAVKKKVRPAKVGHTGTLDPAAAGLMVILIGAATRALDYLDETTKHYAMLVRLGEETDSGDREGEVVAQADPSGVTLQAIEEVLGKYRGVIDQVPPHFSALKKDGVPLYKLARKGVFPELSPRKVEIFSLIVTKWECPFLELDLVCSKGTYARSIARDVGRDLGVGGRLEELLRTASGPFKVEDAITLDDVMEGGSELISRHLITLAQALGHIPTLTVLAAEARRLMRGSPVVVPRSRLLVSADDDARSAARLYKVVSGNDGLVILVRPEPRDSDVSFRTHKVFTTWEPS
jgi:tRNA pseudouridine55 synthase